MLSLLLQMSTIGSQRLAKVVVSHTCWYSSNFFLQNT